MTDAFPRVAPERIGVSREGLARFCGEEREAVARGSHAGSIAVACRHGEIGVLECFGWSDREAGLPMHPGVIFRCFSNTKMFTSTALMMLHEEGRFGLDDPVSRYLPEFNGLRVGVQEGTGDGARLRLVEAERGMTVRHLMTHTGGLSYGWDPDSLVDGLYREAGVYADDLTSAQTVAKLGRLPLKSQPGRVWEYSLSCDVMGRLIEVLAGEPLDRFFARRIFDPLDLSDTGFYVPARTRHRLAANYMRDGKGVAVRRESERPDSPYLNKHWNFTRPPTYFGGGGGLVSTVRDHLRFFQALANGGELNGARLVGPGTVALMTRNHLPPDVEVGRYSRDVLGMTEREFGLGFRPNPAPAGKPGITVGWGGAAGTLVRLDRVRNLVILYFVQIYNGEPGRRFFERIYQALEA